MSKIILDGTDIYYSKGMLEMELGDTTFLLDMDEIKELKEFLIKCIGQNEIPIPPKHLPPLPGGISYVKPRIHDHAVLKEASDWLEELATEPHMDLHKLMDYHSSLSAKLKLVLSGEVKYEKL